MNEMQRHRRNFRRKLLATVSSAALLASLGSARAASEDSDRPIVWLDAGGDFDQIGRDVEDWVPQNLPVPISNPSPDGFGRTPQFSYDGDVAVGFQPRDSAWIFTASVRYGRTQKTRRTHDQAYATGDLGQGKYSLPNYAFLNASEKASSSHAILDFTAGTDVGLGLVHNGKSTIRFGVRAAQFKEHADGMLTAFSTAPAKYSPGRTVHKADSLIARSFSGAGPSVSWDGAAPLIGSMQDGFSFDWGANAALLFGRQKSDLLLHTKDVRYQAKYPITISHSTAAPLRNKNVIVPNVGGFAGLSWRLPNFKVSLGYRADFFFNAIDGGIDAAKKENRGFNGPYASVSIGIGD